VVAFLTGGAWAMYFTDAPTLVAGLVKFQVDELSLIFIGLFTSTTYLLGGWAPQVPLEKGLSATIDDFRRRLGIKS